MLKVKDQYGDTKEIPMMFWNPTVANLTLMALGSSAPEILLSCIETIGGLNKCPGELGASTIVGSAAFNLLVIAGVSIYAVTEKEHDDLNADPNVPEGVKKINDMGVFTITCSSSLWAYIWLFICVRDNAIESWEAWSTFFMFFILIILAFAADKFHNMTKKDGINEPLMQKGQEFGNFATAELYRELIAEKMGEAKHDKESVEKRDKMKAFLKANYGTDDI
jgi:solute carrier family 8 (sodium/calcium exchanger)